MLIHYTKKSITPLSKTGFTYNYQIGSVYIVRNLSYISNTELQICKSSNIKVQMINWSLFMYVIIPT